MKTVSIAATMSLVSLTLLIACTVESGPTANNLQAHSFANADWSEPVNLGATINSTFNEQAPSLSPDGLSLYFGSNRPRAGGSTDTDLWVSHRDCADCPWGTPVNLGPVVNSSVGDAGPSLSLDGHLLFFTSARTGVGLNDIYVSRRANPKDDFGWGPPVLLGPGVNTTAFEAGPEYVQSAEDGVGNFYFNRGPSQGAQDIYVGAITRDGETRGPAVLISELSDPTANDAAASVRTDGREIFFGSSRATGAGGLDVWFSVRQSVHDPWSAPQNLAAVNSTATDQQPSLSSDGQTLLFASDRPQSIGGTDIWMVTRTSRQPPVAPAAKVETAVSFSEWSEPVSLGAPINMPGINDQQAALSKDGLSLYFASGRPENAGDVNLDLNIWVSQRACADESCSWGTPVSLGSTVNGSVNDFAPTLSRDKHWLFFASGRTQGAVGSSDIWASYRDDVHDDFAWQTAMNLGTGVNTTGFEGGASYFENEAGIGAQLYYNHNPAPVNTGGDIYVSTQAADGSWGAGIAVPNLSSPSSEQRPSIAHDGRTIYFFSDLPGSSSNDIWASTRENLFSPWTAPVNVGPPISTTGDERHPFIYSHGATEMLFFNRNVATPPAVDFDLFVSTRTRKGGN